MHREREQRFRIYSPVVVDLVMLLEFLIAQRKLRNALFSENTNIN